MKEGDGARAASDGAPGGGAVPLGKGTQCRWLSRGYDRMEAFPPS